LLLVFVFLLVLLVFFLSFCLSERAVVSDEVVDTVDDEEDDDGVAAAVDVEDNVDEHISTPAPVRVEEECGTDSASSDDVVVVVAAAAAAVPGDAENDLDERLTSVSGCREVSAMLDCDEEES